MSGHDIMSINRFSDETSKMLVFKVISDKSVVGFKGDFMRLFLNDLGYQRAKESELRQEIKILEDATVNKGHICYS